MSKSKFTVIKLDRSFLNEVSRCHISAFPKSFSSKLGLPYVKKMLEWYLVSDNRFLLGVEFKSQIIGYVGSARGYGSTSAMMQYTFWHAIISVIKKPKLIFYLSSLSNVILIFKNFARRIFRSKKNNDLISTKINEESKASIGLIVIGVDSNFQSQGIGSMLLEGHYNQCKSLKASLSHLSVKNINAKAINTYKKNGWKIIKKDKISTSMSIDIK
jgi:ribosomal protein S18 acetylase RimI-like enzyme